MQKTFCGFEPPSDPGHVTEDPSSTGTSQPHQNDDQEPNVVIHRRKRSTDEEDLIQENFGIYDFINMKFFNNFNSSPNNKILD